MYRGEYLLGISETLLFNLKVLRYIAVLGIVKQR